MSYTVESVDITPDLRDLNKAVAGTPADAAVTAAMPSDLPDSLVQLANRITAKADTRQRRQPRSRRTFAAASSPTAPSRFPAAAMRRCRTSCCAITRATANSSHRPWR